MASGIIHPMPFLLEDVVVASTDTDTIAANSGANFTKSVAKTGYTAVGIVGIHKQGQNYANVFLTQFFLDGQNAIVGAYNSNSSSRTISIVATIMYVKA